MFNFFKSKPKMPEISDRIWMSETAKFKGFITDIKNLLEQKSKENAVSTDLNVLDSGLTIHNPKVCILYFFENTSKFLSTLLKNNNLQSIEVISALELEKSSRLQHQLKELLEKSNCYILFAEHYPLARIEKPILEKIAMLHSDKIKVCFYTSLEDPIMEAFGSERIKTLMISMGMKEDEVLEHKMISASLQQAQGKLDGKVKNELKTDSAKDWFLKNFK